MKHINFSKLLLSVCSFSLFYISTWYAPLLSTSFLSQLIFTSWSSCTFALYFCLSFQAQFLEFGEVSQNQYYRNAVRSDRDSEVILSPIQTELFRKPGDSVKATKTCFPFSLGGVRGNSRGTTEGMFLKFGLIWLMRVGRGGNQQAWMRGSG